MNQPNITGFNTSIVEEHSNEIDTPPNNGIGVIKDASLK